MPASDLGSEPSLSFGEDVEWLFFNLFFNVEFQKFLISLSVRPGRRAAIWDHLNYQEKTKIDEKNNQPVPYLARVHHDLQNFENACFLPFMDTYLIC